MRLVSFLLALVLAPPAAAQTPPAEMAQPKYSCRVKTETGFFVGSDYASCVQEMQKQRNAGSPVSPRPPACRVDYSEIVVEQKASDQKLREMKRRGEVAPVVHQFEQEMYYEDRRARLYEKTCGTTEQTYRPQPDDMRQKVCRALGVVCKPRKHW